LKGFVKCDYSFFTRGTFTDCEIQECLIKRHVTASYGLWLSSDIKILNRISWLAFDASIHGNVLFRIDINGVKYYYNGSAWVTTSTAFNTYAQFVTGFPSLTYNVFKIEVKITGETDYLEYFRIAYNKEDLSSVDFIGSLKSLFSNALIPVWVLYKMPSSSNKIILTSIDKIAKYDYQNTVFRVYPFASFPSRSTDYFSSWNDTTKEITLNQTLTLGTQVWIEFYTKINYIAGVDAFYIELDKIPAIWLINIDSTRIDSSSPRETMLVGSKYLVMDEVCIETGYFTFHAIGMNLTEIDTIKRYILQVIEHNKLYYIDIESVLEFSIPKFSVMSPSGERNDMVDMEFSVGWTGRKILVNTTEYDSLTGTLNINFENL
jgi:hypothetical protein